MINSTCMDKREMTETDKDDRLYLDGWIDRRERDLWIDYTPWLFSKGAEKLCRRKTDTQVFIAAFFIIAKMWKSPRCPLVDERLHTLWPTHTMECAKWNWTFLSGVRLFETPWTTQSVELSRPEYWSGWPFPSPGDLPNPGIEPRSPALQVDSLPAEPPGKPKNPGAGSWSLLQGIFRTQELN